MIVGIRGYLFGARSAASNPMARARRPWQGSTRSAATVCSGCVAVRRPSGCPRGSSSASPVVC